jgi:hypothetical protein
MRVSSADTRHLKPETWNLFHLMARAGQRGRWRVSTPGKAGGTMIGGASRGPAERARVTACQRPLTQFPSPSSLSPGEREEGKGVKG